MKILPQKKGIEKSFWVKKFIKKIEYSKEEIVVIVYYKENPEREILASDASGWVRAATGKEKFSDCSKDYVFTRADSIESMEWLPGTGSSQTIEIILPNTIHGCKKRNLKNL